MPRRKKEEEEKEKERKRVEKLEKREKRRREREEKRRLKAQERKRLEEERQYQAKIQMEERRFLVAQRKLESIRLLGELFSRIKVIAECLLHFIVCVRERDYCRQVLKLWYILVQRTALTPFCLMN